jgi:tetratricopeptide (TPR) repeat protein
MDDLRQLLFEKGRVGKVLKTLKYSGRPDPASDPSRALLYGHALCLFGDYQQALKIYTAVPPDDGNEAERLWGLGNASLRLGNLKQVGPLLNEALSRNVPSWLGPQIFISLVTFHINLGQFEEAESAIEKGVETAQRGNFLIDQLILEGNRGVVKICQGDYEDAAFRFENVVKPLLIRDSVLAAAHFLINLSSVYQTLGASDKAENCLNKAEELIEESGSRGRLVFLRQVQGNFWIGQKSLLSKAEWAFKEALDLMRELPDAKLEIHISCNLAKIYFEKGDLSAALDLVESAFARAREKGLSVMYDLCLVHLGNFALRSGETEKGIALLLQAREASESIKKWNFYVFEALHLAEGYAELNNRDRALEWLKKCIAGAKQYHMASALYDEKDVLTALLLKIGQDLLPTEFLSRLIIQLRNPVLLKRLLQHKPEGKVNFLRALKVHDARYFRAQLTKLKDDPVKEVRQTSRLLLNGWQQHAGYRVYTLGSFRVFLEGKMFTHKDWILPGVERLFLFFITHPDEWHTTDSLLETLWRKPHPKKTLKVLNNLFSYLRSVFEPWHLHDMDYVFFQSRRGAYSFFPGERFWIDSQVFLDTTKSAEKGFFSKNLKETRKTYREALDLYQGDYLKEYPYEDWLNQSRDYLKEVYFRSVLRYATLERESGNLSESRRVLEDALFKDPSRSGCAALLIHVLVQMKLSQEAKDWGKRHVAYMKKELKEKPAPEVVEALSRLAMKQS